MEEILSTHGLTKIYGQNAAVNEVNIHVNKGDIYGFVGLNGSGKTTFIRLVTSLIKPSRGNFELFGNPGRNPENLRRISSMVETPSIYQNLSAYDCLAVQCHILGLSGNQSDTIRSILDLVGIANTGKKSAKNFSLGMRQRLGLAMALIGGPEFMLLDEPTNGLDPAGIVEIRELLLKLNHERGVTILISSHILSELGKFATRYGFIHRGSLIQEISSEELHAACGKRLFVEVDNVALTATVLTQKGIPFKIDNNIFEILAVATVSDIYGILSAAGVNILSSQNKTDDLEAYFMNLIKGEANNAIINR